MVTPPLENETLQFHVKQRQRWKIASFSIHGENLSLKNVFGSKFYMLIKVATPAQ